MTHPLIRQSGELPWWFPLVAVAVVAGLAWWTWSQYIVQRVGPSTPGLVTPADGAQLLDLTTFVWRHTEPDATRLANMQFLICVYDKAAGENCGWPGPLAPMPHRRWTVAATAIPNSPVPGSNLDEYTYAIPAAEALAPPGTLHWTVAACWEPRTDACTFALERRFELVLPVNIAADVSIRYVGTTNEFTVSFLARAQSNADTGPFEYAFRYVPIAVDQFGQRRFDWNDDSFLPNPQFVTDKCEIIPANAANLPQAVGIKTGTLVISIARTFDGSPTYPAGVGIPGGTMNPVTIHVDPPVTVASPAGMAACLEVDPNNLIAETDENDNVAFEWEKGL